MTNVSYRRALLLHYYQYHHECEDTVPTMCQTLISLIDLIHLCDKPSNLFCCLVHFITGRNGITERLKSMTTQTGNGEAGFEPRLSCQAPPPCPSYLHVRDPRPFVTAPQPSSPTSPVCKSTGAPSSSIPTEMCHAPWSGNGSGSTAISILTMSFRP